MKKSSLKSVLRLQLYKKRAGIGSQKRLQKSKKIIAKLFKNRHFIKAKRVAFYWDKSPEVRTREALRRLIQSKELFLPRVNIRKKTLSLHRVLSFSKDLRNGPYSIAEPKRSCPVLAPSKMDLIIVPGVGFDKKGNRLGRGAGYYDRLLKKAENVRIFGLCFREQLAAKIPATKDDVPVDRVFTD